MKTSVLLFIILLTSVNYPQSNPEMEWLAASWEPKREIPFMNSLYGIAANSSGEDWIYGLNLSFDQNGIFDGYICGGYSSFLNQFDTDFINGCYTANPPNPKCEELESSEYKRGIPFAKVLKFDNSGNMLWYKYYGEDKGIFQGVIQTSNKKYLAFGESKWRTVINSILYYYQVSGGNVQSTTLACAQSAGSNIYIVKLNFDGTVDWQYIYGIWPEGNALGGAIAFDAVEADDGGFILVGSLPINGSARMFIMKINSSGILQWIQYYGNSPFNHRCEVYSIARNNNQNQYVITGRLENYTNTYASVAFIGRFSEPNNFMPPSPIFTFVKNDLVNAQNRVLAYDICFNNLGYILVPVLYNLQDAEAGSGAGSGKVYKFDPYFKLNDNPLEIFDVAAPPDSLKAYDLKMGITPTLDGGFAVVSSKWSGITPTLPNIVCDWYNIYRWWETDAYLAKFDANGTFQWDKKFDSHIPRAPISNYNYPADVKKEECLYQIRQNPFGDFIIAGNNSNDFDDDYLVKLSDHTNLDLHDIVTDPNCGSLMEYRAINSITAGQNFIIQQIGGTNFVAGNQINLEPGFQVKLGSTFKASILNNFYELTSSSSGNSAEIEKSGHLERVENGSNDIPKEFYMKQNFPNPFNPLTNIEFGIPIESNVTLKIYNFIGQEVVTLIDNITYAPGNYNKKFDASNLSSGIYFYKIEFANYLRVKKMILIK